LVLSSNNKKEMPQLSGTLYAVNQFKNKFRKIHRVQSVGTNLKRQKWVQYLHVGNGHYCFLSPDTF